MITPIISCPTRRENVVSTFRIPITTFEIFSQYKSLNFEARRTGVLLNFAFEIEI